METTVNDRLNSFVKLKEIKPPTLYNKIGVNRSTWSGWINSGRPIPLDKVIKIIKHFPDLDARWLLTGEYAAPAKAKPYKTETELDFVNNRGDYCKLCREKDILIEELREDKAWLKKQVEDKKETGFADSAQIG